MNGFVDVPLPDPCMGRRAVNQRGISRPRVGTRESLRFLTEVGNTLAASLDYQATLQKVAELTVPRLACYCEVDLIEDGGIRRVGIAHADPAQAEALSRRALFVERPGHGPLAEVLCTGEPMVLPALGSIPSRPAFEDRGRIELLRLIGATSLLLIPLIARGRALGVMLLASTRSDRFYGPRDLALADELARIAALAIDNARLYSEANQAIRARDEMLRVVSHDLRNPIGAMATAASLVLDDSVAHSPDSSSGRMLRTIVRASKQATRLIDDLLDLSRIETGRLAIETRPEPLTELVMEAVELHVPEARQRAIELGWIFHEPLPEVMVDRERILQLLGNLLGNAIKFTPAGGRVEVEATLSGDEVRIGVLDTGPGIAPDHLPRVFDRFWQASRGDRGGLGLGLAIVQGIAEAHGGRVWVESTSSGGAGFFFTVPVAGS